ncbi:MAG: hypothetical protein KC620_18260 [Myxococcales bacterium]|nr:hypothetical protein [Myxococcales bacterium]
MRVRLLIISLVFVCSGCASDDEDDAFTPREPVPPSNRPVPEAGVEPPAVVHRRDADLTDQGVAEDAGADAQADDASHPVDAAPTVDAAPPVECRADGDCALLVRLDRCDPCPVTGPVAAINPNACVVRFQPGNTLSNYEPAECWLACGEAASQFCLDEPTRATCTNGRCTAQ